MSAPFSNFSEAALPPQPPLKRPARWWLWALLAAGGTLFVFCLGCGGLLYLGASGVSSREPTDAERQTVVSVVDLAPFGIAADKLAERETWRTKRNLDGSLEIDALLARNP